MHMVEGKVGHWNGEEKRGGQGKLKKRKGNWKKECEEKEGKEGARREKRR